MRKYNKVKQLHRTAEHRRAMLNNMTQSLFYHERVKSTSAKVKALRPLIEKLITRARKNLNEGTPSERKLHNIRIVSRYIKDKEVLKKVFDDIAPRFKDRPGGYTRVIKLGHRDSDKSEMAFLELVDRKELPLLKDERKKIRKDLKKGKTSKPKTESTVAEPEKK